MPGIAYRSEYRSSRPEVSHLHCGPAGKLWGCSLLVNQQPFSSQDPFFLQRVHWPTASPDCSKSSSFFVPSQHSLMCPEQIAAEDISFPNLCQTTFYLIPCALPLCFDSGCAYDPETRQTPKARQIGKVTAGHSKQQLHAPWGLTNEPSPSPVTKIKIKPCRSCVHLHSSPLSIVHCTIT